MPEAVPPKPVILAFGEVLWDVVGEKEFIGGAPFNFAAHAVRCGLSAQLYSRIGGDARGKRAAAELARLGIGHGFLQTDPVRPTGWVDVTLNAGEPSYTIGENAAWDAIAAPGDNEKTALRTARFAALVCGTLAVRSATTRDALQHIRRLLPEVPVFYDVNLRDPHTPLENVKLMLPGVALLKVNQNEADLLAERFYGKRLSATELFARLRDEFQLKQLILTRGADGATLVSEEGDVQVPATPVKVASAVGAGDAFGAAYLAGWLRHEPVNDALARANRIAGWVATQPEAVPEYPTELLVGK